MSTFSRARRSIASFSLCASFLLCSDAYSADSESTEHGDRRPIQFVEIEDPGRVYWMVSRFLSGIHLREPEYAIRILVEDADASRGDAEALIAYLVRERAATSAERATAASRAACESVDVRFGPSEYRARMHAAAEAKREVERQRYDRARRHLDGSTELVLLEYMGHFNAGLRTVETPEVFDAEFSDQDRRGHLHRYCARVRREAIEDEFAAVRPEAEG